jgi:hypothetical protein
LLLSVVEEAKHRKGGAMRLLESLKRVFLAPALLRPAERAREKSRALKIRIPVVSVDALRARGPQLVPVRVKSRGDR